MASKSIDATDTIKALGERIDAARITIEILCERAQVSKATFFRAKAGGRSRPTVIGKLEDAMKAIEAERAA